MLVEKIKRRDNKIEINDDAYLEEIDSEEERVQKIEYEKKQLTNKALPPPKPTTLSLQRMVSFCLKNS